MRLPGWAAYLYNLGLAFVLSFCLASFTWGALTFIGAITLAITGGCSADGWALLDSSCGDTMNNAGMLVLWGLFGAIGLILFGAGCLLAFVIIRGFIQWKSEGPPCRACCAECCSGCYVHCCEYVEV